VLLQHGVVAPVHDRVEVQVEDGLVAAGQSRGDHVGVQGALGSETRTSCRDLVILVNQATEAIPAPNAGGSRNRIRPSPAFDSPGRTEREASVRSFVVVVPHVFVEDTFKVASTPDQHPVQALLPDRPYPALGEGVGVWRLDRVVMIWMPSAATTSSKAPVNLASRSRTRNRGTVAPSGDSSSIERSRARWTTKLRADGR
jgi:hypothetical protein